MLNIKTDLDLRGGTGSSSPLGKDVTYIPQAMQWYHGIFNSEAEPITAESVRVFADESNATDIVDVTGKVAGDKITLGGVEYNVYGEFNLVAGKTFIYIEE